MTTKQRRKRRAPRGPGFTISEFAALPEVDTSSAMIRAAVRNGAIKAIEFNGVKRIPPSEREKFIATWGENTSA